MMQRSPHHALGQRGFTLVEVAIVLIIVGLLLGGAVMTLTAQIEIRNRAETRETLERARDALLGFAAANGRLPCPANGSSGGAENPSPPSSPNVCPNAFNGFVPALTLALTPVDKNGLLIDAWREPIRYSVTNANASAFTTPDGIRTASLSMLTDPKLKICAGLTCGGGTLTDEAVAVLISSGKNLAIDGVENSNNDRVFAQTAQTTTEDDVVIWISPYTLYNRMIAAGAL